MVFQNTGAYRRPPENDSSDPSGGAGGLDTKSDIRLKESRQHDAVDAKYGFVRTPNNVVKDETGFLVNMHATEILDEEKRLISAVDYYFVKDDGQRFKIALPFRPYLYVLIKKVNLWFMNKFVFIVFKFHVYEILDKNVTRQEWVINDPLGQPTDSAGGDCRLILEVWAGRTIFVKLVITTGRHCGRPLESKTQVSKACQAWLFNWNIWIFLIVVNIYKFCAKIGKKPG